MRKVGFICVKSTQCGVNGSCVINYTGVNVGFVTSTPRGCFPSDRLITGYGRVTSRANTAVAFRAGPVITAGGTSIVTASI